VQVAPVEPQVSTAKKVSKKRKSGVEGLAFETISEEELLNSNKCHLAKKTQNNVKTSLNKWTYFLSIKYPDGNVPAFTAKLLNVLLMEFMNGIFMSSGIAAVKSFKNLMSNISQFVIQDAMLVWESNPEMKPSRNKYVELKTKFASRTNSAPAKPRSVGYTKDQSSVMRVRLAEKQRTTYEQQQLLDLCISAWIAPRCETKYVMQMHHLLFAVDEETRTEIGAPIHGCGLKLVKNYSIDKTNKLEPNQAVLAGELDQETTMYCTCLTHDFCSLKVIFEHVEAMKDGNNTMKHKYGSSDGVLVMPGTDCCAQVVGKATLQPRLTNSQSRSASFSFTERSRCAVQLQI
jgi:hypothetical protein